MALINCPECKKEVSDQSNSCPNCGFPIKSKSVATSPVFTTSPPPLVNNPDNSKKKESKKGNFIINAVAIIFGSWLVYTFITYGTSSSSSENKTAISQETTIDIETTASKMINTYEANEVKADAIYKDKVIKVTGIVASISSDIADSAVVSLAPGGDEYAITSVMASGNDNFHNQAIQLEKGQKVTLICIGKGEVIGSPSLGDCRFS